MQMNINIKPAWLSLFYNLILLLESSPASLFVSTASSFTSVFGFSSSLVSVDLVSSFATGGSVASGVATGAASGAATGAASTAAGFVSAVSVWGVV